jgi:uncharacterized membrane protein
VHTGNTLLKRRGTVMELLWVAISIIALIVVVVLLIITRRSEKQYPKPSNLMILGMSLVVLGIIFGDDRLIGYSFIGVGVLLSVVDAIRNRRK